MLDLSEFFKELLHKYTSPILGDYFNTALLIIFGLIFAVFFYFVPKSKKKFAAVLASVIFILISSPLLNFAVYLLIIAVLFLCSNYDFPLRKIIFWGTEAFLIVSTVVVFKIFNTFSAFFSFAAYYTAYRTIHYYVDSNQNPDVKSNFFNYLFYIFFFPSFSHGPIERIENVNFEELKKEHIIFGMKKIFIGIAKFLAVIYFFSKINPIDFSFAEWYKWILLTAYLGAIKLYLLFSGDIDIVLGIASLLGIRLSENFPKFPYIQTSLTKFWQNWQATIVNFLTAYVYFPLCRNRKRIYLKTMIIIMIIGWAHLFYNTKDFPSLANIIYYTLWGIFLGGAFALSKYLERKKADSKKMIEEKYPALSNIIYSNNIFVKLFNIWITFTIIAVGWLSPLYLILTHL